MDVSILACRALGKCHFTLLGLKSSLRFLPFDSLARDLTESVAVTLASTLLGTESCGHVPSISRVKLLFDCKASLQGTMSNTADSLCLLLLHNKRSERE